MFEEVEEEEEEEDVPTYPASWPCTVRAGYCSEAGCEPIYY
jgi:hypothetical protein